MANWLSGMKDYEANKKQPLAKNFEVFLRKLAKVTAEQ